jgi:hypothetical protein
MDVDELFTYFSDPPLEHVLSRTGFQISCVTEKLVMKLIQYRLEELDYVFFSLIYSHFQFTEKVLRRVVEMVVDVRFGFLCIQHDNSDIRNVTKILLEMGQDTEFTPSQLTKLLSQVVAFKTGFYSTVRNFVEQLFVLDMIICSRF